ncbi:hypothetical protein LINGRAHAP2_LOCUS19545 [Linum grandiflorum]
MMHYENHFWSTNFFPSLVTKVLVLDICVIPRQKLCWDASSIQSRGIWVWGTPIELDINGVKTSVFYLDTEGFESIGKSNVYDDR